jgi:hypothetical protein
VPAALQQHVRHWLAGQHFTADDRDCTITVMLKILDGKCKMSETDKVVMAALYDALGDADRDLPGQRFGTAEHALIATARQQPADDALRLHIYEQRVLAETTLSRPVMKAYKAMLREQGLFANLPPALADDSSH